MDEVAEDTHPGFDYKERNRRPMRQVAVDPMSLDWIEDDLRPNLYSVPRDAYSARRTPRWGQDFERRG